MKKIIHLALFLGIVSILAAGALSYSNSVTAPIIKKNNDEFRAKLLKTIDGNAQEFVSEDINEGTLIARHLAKVDGKVIDTIYEVAVNGFQSEVKFLIAINTDGKFNGFKVISQAETPGYGTQIETSEKYQAQFKNTPIDGEIDTITGSTITTAAVKSAILEAVEHFNANK